MNGVWLADIAGTDVDGIAKDVRTYNIELWTWRITLRDLYRAGDRRRELQDDEEEIR